MLRVAIVGLGRRSLRCAIPYILSDKTLQLEAVCDFSNSTIKRFKEEFPDAFQIPSFVSVSTMITSRSIDCAYVAVPHYMCADIVKKLLASKIHVLREKPAAMTALELESLQGLAKSNDVTLSTASQYRYSEQFRQMEKWLPLIGKIRFADGIRKISVRDLGAGWRASKVLSGGGVLIDLGWHLVDLVVNLLSDDSAPGVQHAKIFQTHPSQPYDCEDTAQAILNIHNSKLSARGTSIPCSIFTTRLGPNKAFQLTIYGEFGSLRMDGDVVELNLLNESEVRSFTATSTSFEQMMRVWRTTVARSNSENENQLFMHCDRVTMQTIDIIYARAGTTGNTEDDPFHSLPDSSKSNSIPDCMYRWPLIDGEVVNNVEKQLHENVSIYDNSGIIGKFEHAWKMYHGSAESFTLLHNSGTNALQALYFAGQLQPGDEVIFPVYSFHATSSPAMQFGVIPVFCDASDDGNISPKAILAAITPRTKAIVVTHMWGIPCNMEAISKILQDNPGILLFEDCSHAYGAKIDGQLVGTFGDAAAWSLQGQKIISGGEGGITLTKHAEFYYRQLLWGHYNKRCKAEIPDNHPLRSFALTGAGAKNRIHPLAVAIAFSQLQNLSSIHQFKTLYAFQMISRLAKIPFLKVPNINTLSGAQLEPAWYALVVHFYMSQAPRRLTRESYVYELHKHGLCEIDIPKSTGLLYREPLYTSPHKLFPHLYQDGITQGLGRNDQFPTAQAFYDNAIKLPVWSSRSDQTVVDYYVDIMCAVAEKIIRDSQVN
ncbi:hypothetical protein OCU04_001066 [Sclerotinia nivalis]|uniref:Uncharacterized protein n=1 Tax=Sclerotinia nivalis TaxID=352851 RepID=A0A9X0DQD2_9HELO|nr:hypothetical protein OCU04_001066 [Sclerotinia nivalis]